MKSFQIHFITDNRTIRWLKILNALKRKTTSTAQELSNITSTTTRTCIKDIQDMNIYFDGAIYIHSSKVGYTFEEKKPQKYLELKQNLLHSEPLFQLMRNIFHNRLIDIPELAHEFHLSESSFLRHIKKIQPIFSRYDISLSLEERTLVGNEINIRRFFYDFYYESDITPHTVLPSISLNNLTLDLQKTNFFKEYMDISFGSFNYILYIIIERFKSGKSIEIEPGLFAQINDNSSHLIFDKLNDLIFKYFNIKLTQVEIVGFYALLLSNRTLFNLDLETKFCKTFKKEDYVNQVVEEYLINIATPLEEKQRSKIFVTSFFTAVSIKHRLSPILNQNLEGGAKLMKIYYNKEWQSNLKFVTKFIQPILNLNTDQVEDISTNLTLFIDSMKELYWKQPKNIAFFLESNRFVCQSIQISAEKYLGGFQNLYFPNSVEIIPEFLEKNKIDIVITNHNDYISDYTINITHIKFKTFPDSNDWNKLFKLLDISLFKIFSLSDIVE